MNVKKAIKRIAALGTGAALMGATVLGAMAADLSNFPQPFVRNGQFNAMLVIGESAQTPDVIGAIDIATTLQYEMRTPAAVSGTASEGQTVSVSGDSVRVDQSFDRLTFGKELGDVMPSLTKEDLSVLADGTFDGETYTQTIELGNGSVSYGEGDGFFYDEEPGWYLEYNSGDVIYTYVMEFSRGVSTSNLDNWDGRTISMLGMEYTVDDVSIVSGNFRMELLGGESSDVIEEGATRTFMLDGKEYEITVVFVGEGSGQSNVARLRVNGELTGTMTTSGSDSTYELSDGTEIGIREILLSRRDADPHLVEFFLGADRIVLEHGQALERGDERYDNVQVSIEGSHSTSGSVTSGTIDSIRLEVSADREDYALAEGDSVAGWFAQTDDTMFGNLDIRYEGNTAPSTTEIRFRETREDEEYSMEFNTRAGRYNLPVATKVGSDLRIGAHRNDAVLWVTPNATVLDGNWSESTGAITWGPDNVTQGWINVNDRFLLNTDTSSPEDTTSAIYSLQRIRWDNNRYEVTIRDEASGGTTREVVLRNASTSLGGDAYLYTGTVRVNGQTHTLGIARDETDPAEPADTKLGLANAFHPGVIALESGTYLSFDVPQEDGSYRLVEDGNYTVTHVVPADKLSGSNDEELVIVFNTDGFSMPTGNAGNAMINDRYDVSYSTYGVRIEDDTEASRDRVDMRIPFAQLLPQVYVTSGAVSVEARHEEATGDAYDIAPISAGIARLDTDVANTWRNNNVIVVGGPCVNSVAAELMGNPENCAEGFSEGRATIRLFEQNNNVAMLVAGYSAADSVRAATVVANYRQHNNFAGTEVEVSGTSMANLQVTSVN